MAVARQHIFVDLVGHPLTYGIDSWLHCGRRTLADFGLVGDGKEFSDVFRDLCRHARRLTLPISL